MPPLRDEDTIAKFHLAFEERNSGGVLWKQLPAEWIRKNLDGYSQEAINRLLYQHIAAGGEIDQATEGREGYRHLYQYHYDFRLPILGRLIYVETRLSEAKMGPTVTVVNIHDA